MPPFSPELANPAWTLCSVRSTRACAAWEKSCRRPRGSLMTTLSGIPGGPDRPGAGPAPHAFTSPIRLPGLRPAPGRPWRRTSSSPGNTPRRPSSSPIGECGFWRSAAAGPVPGNVFFDTAASPLMYGPEVFRRAVARVGSERILYGSDYPLFLYPRQAREPTLAASWPRSGQAALPESDLGESWAKISVGFSKNSVRRPDSGSIFEEMELAAATRKLKQPGIGDRPDRRRIAFWRLIRQQQAVGHSECSGISKKPG